MPTLYAMRSAGPSTLAIAKFDDDFNVAETYTIEIHGSRMSCSCPAGVRPSCRHRNMVGTFTLANAINSDNFYCYETQLWYRPIAVPASTPGPIIDAAKVDAARGWIDEAPTPSPEQSPTKMRR